MSAARKLKRQQNVAFRKTLKTSTDFAGIRVRPGDEASFVAVLYCLGTQTTGHPLVMDFSAWRPGKIAAFWRHVNELKDKDLAYLRGLKLKGMSAGKAGSDGPATSASVGGEPLVNLRI